jgi:hypothetical protein
MTDIFLSYKHEDEARVGRLVEALEKAGLKVWWDRGLPGGESWRANIQAALDGAKCVVVAWTQASVGPAGDFVRDEAGQAKARGVLVPVFLEKVRAPLGFGEIQAIDLSHWRGAARDPFFLDLVAACEAKIAGRSVPPARGPMARLMRRLTLGSLASAAAAGAFAFAMNFFSLQNHACALPLAQPGLSDACGALGLGERPTRAARLAFEALPQGDCQALQAFRAAHEQSPLRALADSRLAARVVAQEERWAAGERRLALFVGGATESEARARAGPRAEQLCRAFAASTQFKLDGADAIGTFACEDGSCGITGEAVCRLQERQVVERETCGGVQ